MQIVTILMDINALLDRIHNFIIPLVRGRDHVCDCTCGRHQAYHVIPYNGAEEMVDSRENDFVSDIMTQQEMDVISGLLLGLCIGWFLLWLDGVWHSGLIYWRANRMNGRYFQNTKDSRGDIVHHDVNDT
ncbi:transmembrane protein 240-like isoform X1 [Seriola aureovittata]|uniref:transmembrane protein 240-like isoform X1 n=2 Tax=Seriola aureovittata TaxID=2871759 RepID=UPI0024BDF089|nr:transmembrane protein 240-like isoform X1 [Seriola aureovittata]